MSVMEQLQHWFWTQVRHKIVWPLERKTDRTLAHLGRMRYIAEHGHDYPQDEFHQTNVRNLPRER